MLSLELPTFEAAGLTVYQDHALPHQFYYAAPPPRVARTGGRLMFDVLAYTVELKHSVLSGTAIPDELGAGFLTMGAECVLSAAQRALLVQTLEGRTGLREGDLSLSPIPYHAGSVSVLALDRFSAPAEPGADPGSNSPVDGRPTFVEQILGSGKPALMGDLRTIFSLSLSQQGVAFLEGLYGQNAAPVGVVYDLKFYGLRPSVDAVVHANLSRISEHFGGSLGVQYAWARAEIRAGLARLEERGDIRIQLTSQATGEEAQKSKDLALTLFRDRIVQEMFRPTVPPVPAAAGQTVPLGSTTSTAAVQLTLDLQRRHEDKVVSYSFQERSPEERTHAPQGFLSVLLSPSEIGAHLHHVSLDSPFFELLEVLVTGPTKEEMAALGIRQIEARLRYGEGEPGVPPEEASLVFRPDSTGDKTFAVKRRGRRSLSYTCALTYEFTRLSGSDGDAFRYDLPARSHTGRALRLNPYADFGVLEVEVEPGRLHPDVREVDVHLTYGSDASAEGPFHAQENVRLNLAAGQAAPSRWQVRTQDTGLRPYTAQYTFVFADGATYASPARTLTEPLLRVDSPFPTERALLIKPVPATDQVTGITVELEYTDPTAPYRRTRLVELSPPFASVTVRWPVLAADRQQVRYRVTVHEPGLISEGEWMDTDEPSLIVGAQAHRVGRVEVRLVGPPLGDLGLDALQVKVTLALPGTPPEEPHSVLLQPGDTQAAIDLTLPPGATLRYRYQILTFRSDGTTRESPWKDSTASPLILSTRAL